MRTTFGLIIVFAIISSPVGVLAVDNEAEARKIDGLLMAPCCGGNTLAMHESGLAQQMRREIREMLASGMNRQEILDHYVAKYGNTILAMPPDRGFNLVVYLLPLLALIGGPLLVWQILRRRVADTPADSAPLPPVDPEYRKRIERELRNY
jgi:cytochrome c-type biogenesis protein CcmH